MPDICITRVGVDSQELDTKFAAGEIEKFKSSLFRVEQEARSKDERIKQLEQTVAIIQKQFPLIAQLVQENDSVAEVRDVVRRKTKTPEYTGT
jgi:t-SNARE complex subunit (syntaxin)